MRLWRACHSPCQLDDGVAGASCEGDHLVALVLRGEAYLVREWVRVRVRVRVGLVLRGGGACCLCRPRVQAKGAGVRVRA